MVVLSCPGQSSLAESSNSAAANQSKWIINSGSSASLPAGSMLSLVLALERGAEAVWLDLVLSKDNQIVLLADTKIDQLTDVKEIYPDRNRPDGSYYSFDFTLEELRGLSHLPAGPEGSAPAASLFKSHLPITALDDFLGYLNLVVSDLTVKPTLIFTLKHGWRHQQEDKNLGATVLKALENYQSTSSTTSLVVASYDPEELQQLAQSSGPGHIEDIGFMQLIGSNSGEEVKRLEFGTYQPYSYDLLFTRFGLKSVSSYADSIGLDPQTILAESAALKRPQFLDDVRTLGLQIVCCRIDSIPPGPATGGATPEALFEYLLFTIGFDGIVTDKDRLARNWLENRPAAGNYEQYKIIERLIDQVDGNGNKTANQINSDATM
ncbi:MAG: glycerophosphodiester phosphodiesterase family protein [Desulfocapsaceae bacterium]